MATKPITPTQRETLAYIKMYRTEFGYSPIIREIQEHFRLASTNAVMFRLKILEREGYLKRDPNLKQREFVPVEANQHTTTTPKEKKSAIRNRGDRKRNQD
jgi:SOS-response transcriptional repressor LexA